MDITDPLTKQIHIKMSGCPNGCGQHHIGNIGFYGASIKVGEHTIPAYVAHIGGNYEGGEVVLRHAPEGAPAGQARARRRRALDPHVRGRAQRGRDVQRLRRARRHRALRGRRSRTSRCRSSSASSTMNHFIDWNRDGPVRGRSAARASARSRATRPPSRSSRTLIERHERVAIACSFQKEASRDHAHGRRASPATRASSRSTPACTSPRPTTRGAPSRSATASRSRGCAGSRSTSSARCTATSCGRRDPDLLLRSRKVVPMRERLAERRRLGRRPAPRPVARARGHAEAALGRQARAVEGQPARGLDRARGLGLHLRARHPLQPAARPRLRVDRLRAVHRAGRRAARAAGPAPTRSNAACTRPSPVGFGTSWIRWSSPSGSASASSSA